MVNNGIQIGIKCADTFWVRFISAQHVQKIRGMPEVVACRDWFLAVSQSDVGRNNRRKLTNQSVRGRLVGRGKTNRCGGHQERIHQRHIPGRRLAQEAKGSRGKGSIGRQGFTERAQLAGIGQSIVPEQPGRLLKRRLKRKFFSRESSDDEFSSQSVDVTQSSFGGNDSVESCVHLRNCHVASHFVDSFQTILPNGMIRQSTLSILIYESIL